MNLLQKKNILYIYFSFQCFACILNFILLTGCIIFCFVITILGSETPQPAKIYIPFYLIIFFIISVFLAYFILTIFSTIATKIFIQNKPLTKLQKICSIAFILITLPLYLFIIIIPFLL